jgi:hypothetical protein
VEVVVPDFSAPQISEIIRSIDRQVMGRRSSTCRYDWP